MKINHYVLFLLMIACAAPAAGQTLKSMPGQELEAINSEELQALTRQCNACHGPNGVSDQADIPTLAGQSATAIVEAIEQFYFYERHCPSTKPRHGENTTGSSNMCDVSGRMNKQEAQALGEYYEAQEAPTEDAE